MKNEPLFLNKSIAPRKKTGIPVLENAEFFPKIYPSYSSSEKDEGLKKTIAALADYYDANEQIGIVVHDENGIQVFANCYAKRLLNELKAETINHLWKNEEIIICINEKPTPLNNAPFIKALRTGRHQKQTFNIHMKDGKQRSLFLHSKPLLKKGNAVAGCIISSVIDISNEKRNAAGLEERNNMILSFIKQTPHSAWIVDEDGNLVYATAAFFKYFGLKEKESIGKKLAELVPLQVSHALYAKHLRVLTTGRPLKIAEQMETVNGKCYSSLISLFAVKNTRGKKMIAGHAIYLQRHINDEIKHKQQKNKLIVLSHATSDPIWEWDIRMGRIYMNKEFMNMFDYNPKHFTGPGWGLRRIHPDDRDRIKNKIQEACAKGFSSWQEQYRFKCAGGSYKQVQDKGYIIYENNLAVRMIGVVTDLCKIKKLEDQLAKEKRRRQAELSKTALHVQETERTRIGLELHDNINQLLLVSKLFIDVIRPSDEKEIQAKEKSLEYIMTAIHEIRKLSKELVTPQLKEMGLAESIQVLIDDIHFVSPLRFKFTYDSDLRLLSPDKKMVLFRIVQEQVKNIIKHSEAKTAGISFSICDRNVVLQIWDTGIGFKQDESREGIGLSNIKERLLLYNGKVKVNTAPGRGCCMYVTLPVI